MRRVMAAAAALVLLVGCGGDDDDDGGEASTPAKDARELAVIWCDLTIGDDRVTVVEAMGEPTNDTDDSTSWIDGQFQFIAFYDVDDRARQLLLQGPSTDEEREDLLTCDPVRTND